MKVLYFVSSKGGCGKSFVIKKLSEKLSKNEKKVLVCELSFQARFLDLLFDVTDSVLYDISDVANETVSLDDAMCEICDNLFLLCAPLNKKEYDVRKSIEEIVDNSKESFDYILFDVSSFYDVSDYKSIYENSEFVMVADCNNLSVRNADALLSGFDSQVKLLLNRVNPFRIEKGYDKAVDELLDVFHIPLLGVVYEAEGSFDDKMNCIKKDDGKLFDEVFESVSKRLSGQNVPITPYKKVNVVKKLFG